MLRTSIESEIRVFVETRYLPEQSDPEAGRYFFAYRIEIRNQSSVAVRLLARHWVVTDDCGRVEEVHGDGVIGQQPRMAPGETFTYESFCPLPTPTGMMKGRYEMRTDDGECIDVEVPLFYLVEPGSFH